MNDQAVLKTPPGDNPIREPEEDVPGRAGIAGLIVGRAFYDGSVDPAAALEIAACA